MSSRTVVFATSFYLLLPRFIYFFKDFIFIIYFQREGKGGRTRRRETSICVCLLVCPLLGTWPTTEACALTGNGARDLLVRRLVSYPLDHTSQGTFHSFLTTDCQLIKDSLILFLFFKYILLIMLLQLSHSSPLPPPPAISIPSGNPPPQFMSMGCAYKFFGFSISCVILNIPLSILYLPIMLLNPCIFSPILPTTPPS